MEGRRNFKVHSVGGQTQRRIFLERAQFRNVRETRLIVSASLRSLSAHGAVLGGCLFALVTLKMAVVRVRALISSLLLLVLRKNTCIGAVGVCLGCGGLLWRRHLNLVTTLCNYFNQIKSPI